MQLSVGGMSRHVVGRAVATAIAMLALGASPSLAQSVKQIGSYHDWAAYSASSASGPICFAVAKPSEVSPSPDGYTQGYLYLTRRPNEQISNELNLIAGFTMAADQPVSLTIGGHKFPMFAQADSAWLQDPTQNDNLAGQIRAGTSVVIDATSDKGIKVRETFSLSGVTAASKAISGNC